MGGPLPAGLCDVSTSAWMKASRQTCVANGRWPLRRRHGQWRLEIISARGFACVLCITRHANACKCQECMQTAGESFVGGPPWKCGVLTFENGKAGYGLRRMPKGCASRAPPIWGGIVQLLKSNVRVM